MGKFLGFTFIAWLIVMVLMGIVLGAVFIGHWIRSLPYPVNWITFVSLISAVAALFISYMRWLIKYKL